MYLLAIQRSSFFERTSWMPVRCYGWYKNFIRTICYSWLLVHRYWWQKLFMGFRSNCSQLKHINEVCTSRKLSEWTDIFFNKDCKCNLRKPESCLNQFPRTPSKKSGRRPVSKKQYITNFTRSKMSGCSWVWYETKLGHHKVYYDFPVWLRKRPSSVPNLHTMHLLLNSI